MPGLLQFRPLTGMKVDRMQTSAASKSEKLPASSRIRQMGSKVLPLPFPPSQENLDLSGKPVSSASSQQRAKQVSDPIGESVKAKICDSQVIFRTFSTGSSSSGSEHERESVCLADMVHEFMEDEADSSSCGRARCNCETGTCDGAACHESEDDVGNFSDLVKTLHGLSRSTNSLEGNLLAHVSEIVKGVWSNSESVCAKDSGDCSRGCLRRTVMSHLRALGYNAAVCKSRWDHSRGFPGGDYEYVDVVVESPNSRQRFLIDLDFSGQFHIARPTNQFSAVLQAVPSIFVGHMDRLLSIVDIMTDATKKSLKRRAMHLPPWRKAEYMRAKWMSLYKRTTNETPLSGHVNGCKVQLSSLKGWPSNKGVKQEDTALNGKVHEKNLITAAGHGAKEYITARQESEAGRTSAGTVTESSLKTFARESRILNCDWQPPAIKLRSSSGKAGQMKAGLAIVLRESGFSRQTRQAMDESIHSRIAVAPVS